MTYLVTVSEQDANRINKLFLRVWALSLSDQGYGLDADGESNTGVRNGVHVASVTSDWFLPRQTALGGWAVLVPTLSDMANWNTSVNRTARQVRDKLDLPSGLSWASFKAHHGLTTETVDTTLSLTVREWCEGILAAAGINYTIETDDGTLFPSETV